ncbi:hypothetical protein B0T20DRAFT_102301 [Sordaria brevicollis]|uniref:Cyanovirin-N domain-containing protein n=1 Tax=Sordaria brevicollis TaxID=83679 RepID=A0AAE0U2T5_SORBR|nr:hypothetical protein B0T20DRAFT_102301 [Sordaria brevicollis]
MRPNILYLASALLTITHPASVTATPQDDLRPSIWCTAAFLYPGQDRLSLNHKNRKDALKNVFHGFCGLKGAEVSTDIDLDSCLENVKGVVGWSGSGKGISDCDCRNKRGAPLVIECRCPDGEGGNKVSSINLGESALPPSH